MDRCGCLPRTAGMQRPVQTMHTQHVPALQPRCSWWFHLHVSNTRQWLVPVVLHSPYVLSLQANVWRHDSQAQWWPANLKTISQEQFAARVAERVCLLVFAKCDNPTHTDAAATHASTVLQSACLHRATSRMLLHLVKHLHRFVFSESRSS